MNATQWETLTDFTKWLGREGKETAVELVFHGFILGEKSLSVSVWTITKAGGGHAIP